MSLKGLNLGAMMSKPLPMVARTVLAPSKEFEQIIHDETRETDRILNEGDMILDKTPGGLVVHDSTEKNVSGDEKLNRLLDDDFPFDETQLAAVYGLVKEQYGVLIGAAGTGKTTTTKKLVDLLRDGLDEVDVSQYWKRGVQDDNDEYQIPEKMIPSIIAVSFTGRATQQTKKNFPREWHSNIMTIHRALGFYPEYYPEVDIDSGEMINKRRFVPAYTAENKMPWKIILIDEAGMLGLDLWHQLLAACEPDCRIYMVGDINQLPPTHGKSILGFAMSSWPVFELTHVHRQQGANNSIVDNAHRILKGLQPVCDSGKKLSFKSPPQMVEALTYMTQNPDWRFLMVEIDDEHRKASTRIRQCLKLLQGKLYEPNRDVVITPINGFEQTAPGWSLGQAPMNQELVTKLNSDSPRYIIDAGREKMNFAIGDKVMATVNDYEQGITNGMTGLIKDISENGAYIGNTRMFGLIDEVNEYYQGLEVVEDDEDVEFSMDDMVSDAAAGVEEARKKEKKESGPASHIVTIEFGEGEHKFDIAFNSKSSVASLMLAYVATCHKMQGGEAPLVFGIVHSANKRPLNREWFYTMVTRASGRCVVLYTRQGVGFALGKQSVKGVTLAQKIQTFLALTADGLIGPSVRVKLPKACSLVESVYPIVQQQELEDEETELEESYPSESERLPETYQEPEAELPHEEVRPIIQQTVLRVGKLVINVHATGGVQHESPRGTDSGQLTSVVDGHRINDARPTTRLISQFGAARQWEYLQESQRISQTLLTYQPKPEPPKKLSALELIRLNKLKREGLI